MRTYKRKTNQQEWPEEAMKNAVAAVRSGTLSQNKAARQFGIPVASLNRRIKSGKTADEASKKKLGRFTTVFTTDQENALVEHVLQMERRFFGVSYHELRSLAFQFAELNKIPHNFSREKCSAGKDWLYLFLQRHPELRLRTPENTSAARAAGFNKVSVETFFSYLGAMYDKYSFPASRIYNCDETGITTVPNKPVKIISLKGKKQVGSFSSAERGQLVTAEICVSATGHYVPPLLIIPRVRRNPLYEVGLPAESIVAFDKSGWMNSKIFADIWFPHFVKHTHPSEEDPVLLILDGHASHVKNLPLIENARKNHVHILAIPPHTSHRLQPLDVAFMFPLSNFYTQELKNWQRNKPNKVIELSDISQIFTKAYLRAATLSNAESGFRKTGIRPYDPHVFTEIDFAPAELTERAPPINSTAPAPSTSNINLYDNTVVPILSSREMTTSEPPASTSVRDETFASNETLFSQQIISGVSSVGLISPQEILPLPKVVPKQSSRGQRKRGKTAVITSSPYINELKDSQTPCRVKSPKKVKKDLFSKKASVFCKDTKTDTRSALSKKTFKQVSSSSSESYDSDDICEDTSDNSDFIGGESSDSGKSESKFTLTQKEICLNDFVSVLLKEEKKQVIKEFVGQVVRVVEEEESELGTAYEVKFMRNYRQHTDIFIFPEADDISIIYKSEITGVLSKFTILRHGKVLFL